MWGHFPIILWLKGSRESLLHRAGVFLRHLALVHKGPRCLYSSAAEGLGSNLKKCCNFFAHTLLSSCECKCWALFCTGTSSPWWHKIIWVLVTCWLTILGALLHSSYPWMQEFAIYSGMNILEMLQRANMKFWGSLFWGFAPGAGFNLHPRMKEEAGQWETVLRHSYIGGVLGGGGKYRACSSPSPWADQDPPLLSTRAPSLASPPGRGGAPVKEHGVRFPRRWTNLSIWFCHGSHGLFTKEIKACLFLVQDWYRFLRLYVSRAWMSSPTITFTVAAPKLQHPSLSLLGKQSSSYQTNFLYKLVCNN